ncbi:hypothetical protein CSC82_06930 [Rhodobacteraceae bacterium 4F10]|nr:hypothetical protein CSC82_06930 [Rhodobacteraceae bacterium 4F10]
MKNSSIAIVTAFVAISAGPALAMSDADNACIDHLREVGGPDGKAGTILSSSFSEAGTLVMLEDAGGTVWRCIAYSDGAIGEMSVVESQDDGNGAMSAPSTETVVVKFDAGTSGATLTGSLTSGSSTRYVLGAAKDQFLDVSVAPQSGQLGYLIFNPDGSALLDFMTPDNAYRGQLWQSGDHVIEVVNNGSTDATYSVTFGIE